MDAEIIVGIVAGVVTAIAGIIKVLAVRSRRVSMPAPETSQPAVVQHVDPFVTILMLTTEIKAALDKNTRRLSQLEEALWDGRRAGAGRDRGLEDLVEALNANDASCQRIWQGIHRLEKTVVNLRDQIAQTAEYPMVQLDNCTCAGDDEGDDTRVSDTESLRPGRARDQG